LAAKNQVALTFQIQEGEKVKIQRVRFAGVHALAERRLRKAMKSHARGFLGGGEIKDENLTEDAAKIEALYHDNGYRDARVTGHELLPWSRPDRLIYRIDVEEGRPYVFGEVTWAGNTAVPTTALEKGWQKRRNRRAY